MPRGFIQCRSCGAQSTYRDQPDGWYQLSVNDSSVPKRYRYLGVFCSIACLEAHVPEMARVEADIKRKAVS
jgi:hypothetical protein